MPKSPSSRTKLTLANALLWIALAAILVGYWQYLHGIAAMPRRGPGVRGPRGTQGYGTFIFVGCLVLWSVARLKLRERRSALHCRTCGQPIVPTAASKKTGLCPTCHLASLSPRGRKTRVWGALAYLAGLFLLVSFVFGYLYAGALARQLGWQHSAAMALAVVALFLGISGLFLGLVLATFWRNNRRLRRPAELARLARGLVNEPGHELATDTLTAWWTGPEELGSLIQQQADRIGRQMDQLIGPSSMTKVPVSICGFSRRQDYVAFQRRLSLVPTEVDGIYLPGPAPTLLFTTESLQGKATDTPSLLAQLFVYHALNGPKKLVGPLWLQQGLATYVKRCLDNGGSFRVARAALAALESGSSLNADTLFRFTPTAFIQLLRDVKDHASFVRSTAFRNQACSLIDYLSGESAPSARREAFRNYLSDLRADRPPLEALEHRLGVTPDRLLSDWRAWVEQRGPGHHLPPDARREADLESRLLPLVHDRHAEPDDRIKAIRELGTLGYACGASALIDQLADPDEDPNVKTALTWALETISGLGPVPSLDAWHAWFDQLPPEARGTASVDSPAEVVPDQARPLAWFE